MTAGPYQLRVCDLRSDDDVDLLPIQGVQYDDYIGRTGALSGTIPIPDNAMARRVREAILPGRTMLYLERDEEIVWGGILWTRTPTRDARGFYTVPIQAASLESYLRSHRLLLDTLTATGVDQLDIARQLVDYAQAASGGNLGVEIDYTQTSGVLRDRTYSRYDLPWLGVLLDQLAATQGGFEWRFQCYRDDTGARHRALRLGYPLLSVGSTDVILSAPGPVTAYALPEDATVQANAWQSRGASTNQNQAAASVPLMSTLLTTPADIAAGWPRLDRSSDYTSVSDPTVLNQHAAADLARAVRPVVIPSVSYTTGTVDQPQLGSYVRLRIKDDWYPEMLSARYRVVGLRATPAERARAETTELYLEAA
ncbi:hypothetical protein [Kitasatospora sp. NPDC050543]|uniref:hypothetical protein n=1 Tax=Kitasatospora sp. NPDC050543 TaxID=3364054 RepID=UPI0037A4D90B